MRTMEEPHFPAARQRTDDRARNFAVCGAGDVGEPGTGSILATGDAPWQSAPLRRRPAVKVVYNRGLENERIVVSVMRGRPGR
jgi:hypothetical protein